MSSSTLTTRTLPTYADKSTNARALHSCILLQHLHLRAREVKQRPLLPCFGPSASQERPPCPATLPKTQRCRLLRQLSYALPGSSRHINTQHDPQTQKQEQEPLRNRSQLFSQQRPKWLAPPDPHICPVLPIPTIALLTILVVTLEHQWALRGPTNFLRSYMDPKAMLAQVCWIIDLNPHLLDLSLSTVCLNDQRDICIFATSLFGLKKLQRCTLDFKRWTHLSGPGRLGSAVFFSCPTSLRTLKLIPSNEDYSRYSHLSKDYTHLPSGTHQPWEKSDEESGLMTLPRRKDPLPQLTELNLRYLDVDDIMEEDFLTMLEHCPNLLKLPIHTLPHVRENEQLAQDIARCCPKLRILTNETHGRTLAVQELTLRTFGALPPQQLRTIRYICNDNLVIQDLDDVGGLFRRHSSTLQSIVLTGCESFCSKAIQVILVECGALEVLCVEWTAWGIDLTVMLEDAIEFPWASTRIRELQLAIAIPDEPFHYLADGVVPYYNRPPPMTLFVAKTEQFESLEALYRQIGALTELRRLELQAVFFDP